MKWMTALAALLVAAAMTFVACGDDDDEGDGGGQADSSGEPAQLTISTTEKAVEAPGSVAPGVTEITFQNDTKKPTYLQIIRAEGDRTEDQVISTYNSAGEGGKFPDWLIAAGGVYIVEPGGSATVTQELEEGTYYAFKERDDDSKASPKSSAGFEVSGDPTGAELPEAQLVTGSEYTFEAPTLTAGEPIAFENVGQQPHHLIAAPLLPGKSIEDAQKYFKTNKGKAPLDVGAATGTTVIDTDQTLVADLGLKKGKYALICFISDREGGPPHFAKGMVVGATVE